MKRSLKMLLFVAILVVILAVLFMRNSQTAGTREELIDMVRKELVIGRDDTATVTYAGEFVKENDALLWFIIQDAPSTYYRAVACELQSNNRYLFKEVLTPMTYSRDIVHVVWKAEDIFLINDTNCQTIISRDQSGDLLSQMRILPNEYPYIFRLVPQAGESTWSFLDSHGNEIP